MYIISPVAEFSSSIDGFHLNIKCAKCGKLASVEYLGVPNGLKPELRLSCTQHGTADIEVHIGGVGMNTWPLEPRPTK